MTERGAKRALRGPVDLIFSDHEDSRLKNLFAESQPTVGGIMETYTLVVLVALFVGVTGIIVVLERWRRTELTRFEQLQKTLAAIHSSNEMQLVGLTEAVSQLRAAVDKV